MRRTLTPSLLIALATLGWSCDEGLDQAFRDVRASTPEVCADYCIDQMGCEWPNTAGEQGDEAFSGATRQCIIDCAFFVNDGAFVAKRTPNKDGALIYTRHLDGELLAEVLACAYETGSFICTPGAPFIFLFRPSSKEECEAADECVGLLAIDYRLVWRDVDDGVCEVMGEEMVEVPYF